MKKYVYVGDARVSKTSYTKLRRDLKAAERLFNITFQLLPDEDCTIPYLGGLAVQVLKDWLQKNVAICPEDLEEPEINPCRGCKDYDGQGGCKSNGGCGEMIEDHFISEEEGFNPYIGCYDWDN